VVKDCRSSEISPLPISGIIENLYNPLTVFTIFFNFCFVNGNFLPYKNTLKDFVKDLYKGLKVIKHKREVKMKKISNSKKLERVVRIVKNEIYPRLSLKDFRGLSIFDFALKHVFGFNSDTQTRLFVAQFVPEMQYTTDPADLLSEILERGYRKQVMKVIPSLNKNLESIQKVMVGSQITISSGVPLVDSFLNRMSFVRREFDSREGILDRLNNLVTIELDGILFPSKLSPPINRMVHLGRSVKKGIIDVISEQKRCMTPIVEYETVSVFTDSDPFGLSRISAFGMRGPGPGVNINVKKVPKTRFLEYEEIPTFHE